MQKNKMRLYVIVCLAFLICTSIVIVYAYTNIDKPFTQQSVNKFADIKNTDWFCDDVQYMNEKGLMSGTSDNMFSPNDTTTRGMIVTVLWRLEGKPDAKKCTFEDVADDAYYYDAVCWMYENKIVSGYDENTFGAGDYITREQLATIIYRYADYKKYDISKKSSLDKYKDMKEVSGYAVSAFEWANANDIIKGISDDTLSPKGNALRCQVAAIFKRFCNLFIPSNDEIEVNTEQNDNNANAANGHEDKSDYSSGETPSTDNETNGDEIPESNLPEIVVKNTSAHPGEDITVPVNVKNNPGILGMTLTAYYDESCCSLKRAVNGDIFKDILDFTTSKELNSGVRFIWDGIDIANEEIKDGTALILNFHISDTAKSGTYPITLYYADEDIVDKDLKIVSPKITNGCIIVE